MAIFKFKESSNYTKPVLLNHFQWCKQKSHLSSVSQPCCEEILRKNQELLKEFQVSKSFEKFYVEIQTIVRNFMKFQ